MGSASHARSRKYAGAAERRDHEITSSALGEPSEFSRDQGAVVFDLGETSSSVGLRAFAMLITRLLTGFVFAVVISLDARAETFEGGVAAYNRKDYAAAFQLLYPLAERGNAVAQYGNV
jgi:hypothetical protein